MRSVLPFLAGLLVLAGCSPNDERPPPLVTGGGSGPPPVIGPGPSSSSSGGAGGQGGQGGGGGGGQGGSGPATWGSDQCEPPPQGVAVGFNIGDQIDDVIVRDCDDNVVSLTAFCGASATFLFGAFGWCPLCQQVSSEQEQITDKYAPQNVASVNIIIQNGQGAAPDANYCKTWRDNFGFKDTITLYDPTGASLAIWGFSSTSSLSAFLDKDRIIVNTLEHNGDVSLIQQNIDEALAH